MTLLELVVAFLVFGIVMLGIAHTMCTGLALTRTNRHRSVAANLAAQEMDTIRSLDFAGVIARSTTTVEVDGVAYTVKPEVNWTTAGAESSPCDSATGVIPQVLHVRVLVSWPDMNGIPPVKSDTTLSPPMGTYNPNTGHIAVAVTGLDGRPMVDVPVVISGGPQGVGPRVTNSDGCAFFAFLMPGNYTVTLNGAGYVDEVSNATPSKPATVVREDMVVKPFTYEPAARLEVTFRSEGGYAIPGDLPITVWNPHIVPNKQRTLPGIGAARTIGSLFPYDDGYYVWAGACADADAEGGPVDSEGNVIDRFWPDASRGELVAVTPGGSSSVQVSVHDLDILVTGPLGAIPDAEIIATHDGDNLCDGEAHALGRTDASGVLRVALPIGTWTLSVTGRAAATGGWPEAVVDPSGPAPLPVQVVVQ